MGNETNTTHETQFVLRRLEEALRLFGREIEARWFWSLVLLLVLIAGLTYVVLMYRRDSRTVGWMWAGFLGLVRSTVYVILAAVFLLPAWQTWERTETHSKVVMGLDVSGSMSSRDDTPTESMPAEKLPTRHDKIVDFLSDDVAGFVKNLKQKNPIYAYRFGTRADDEFKAMEGEPWSKAEWLTWLRPNPKETIPDGISDEEKAKLFKRQELHQQLVEGTNLGDSLVEILNRESNNMVQGIVVFSDGRSTQYSAQAFSDLRARAKRAKIPLFTVVVGEYRQPISIRITGLQTPEQARPDDKFPVRVEIEGDGLPNREMNVFLDVTTPKGDKRTLEKPFKFNAGAGGPPHAQVEFEIDAAILGTPGSEGQKPELEEGSWNFVARVPKEKREVFLEKEHLSPKQVVQVVKKPLRVLLFAGGASKEYQFVRNLLVREVDQRRAELSICLQSLREGVVQDVPPDRLLKQFPFRLGEDTSKENAADRYANLAEYDLIIAFDPDWSLLQPEQVSALERWINTQAGGLILVAGPVNTFQLARPANRDRVKAILDLLPVTLQDSRLQGLSAERPTTDPWRLSFPGATAEMEFLKLDEESKEQLAGWEQFFTGKTKAESTPNDPLLRGFYSYYPAESAKPGATVVATFSDPRARLREGNKEQPYLAYMPYGSGKVVYLSSGEVWRLRGYRETFFERFWMKLGRFAGSGKLTRLSSRGVVVMGQEFNAGQFVRLEAQLFGRDLQALPPTAVPRVQLKPPTGSTIPTAYDLQPKPSQGGEWTGWFQTRFRVMTPGEYRLELHIPETGDVLPRRFMVKESNPELDNTRPDFGQMYQLASELTEIAPRLDRQTFDEVKKALEGSASRLLQRGDEPDSAGAKPATPAPETSEGKDSLRLFFDLTSASVIPKCMVTDNKVQRSRGPVKDIWDEGWALSADKSVGFAYVLALVVGLLSIEWLTRKLLKLA